MMTECHIQTCVLAAFTILAVSKSVSLIAPYTQEVQDLVDRLGTEFCPYNQFCQSNATFKLQTETETACCRSCSCDEDCWERGTCCPDFQTPETTKRPTEFCNETIVKRAENDNTKFSQASDGIKRYYVITNCPDNEVNKTLTAKCTGSLQKRFEDFVWVSDAMTNKIYKNRFCAECNGIQRYKEWQLGTDCSEILEGDFSYTENEVISKPCRLLVTPPVNLDVTSSQCLMYDISECNKTGNWRIFDKGVKEACDALDLPFLRDAVSGIEVYKNVFCYLCNLKSGENLENVCRRSEDTEKQINGPFSFIAIFNYKLFEEPRGTTKAPCAADKVLDPYMEICRNLTCPILHAPFYGTCHQIALQTSTMSLKVTYRLDPLWTQSTFILDAATDDNKEKVGKAIYLEFQRRFGLLDAKCKACEHSVKRSNQVQFVESANRTTPHYFKFASIFHTDENCAADFITKRLLLPQLREMTIKISSSQIMTFALHLDKRPEELRNIFYKRESCASKPLFIDASKMKICPTIKLDNDDYSTVFNLASTISQRERINTLFGLEEIGSLLSANRIAATDVCFNDYKNLFSDSGSSIAKIRGNVFILSSTVSFVALVVLTRLE